MALGWFRHLAGDRARRLVGRLRTGDHVNPAAVAAMAEVGIDIAAQHPQRWTDDLLRTTDVVVTMGCGDACPVVPGVRYEDWPLDDPAGQASTRCGRSATRSNGASATSWRARSGRR